MSGWRYLAQRLDGQGTSAEFLDLDLPLQEVEISDVLSGAGEIRARINPEVARLLGPDGRPILKKWETSIFAEKDSQLYGGILTDVSRAGSELALICTGFSSYPDGQPWTDPAGYMGINVDPLDCYRVIWDHLQTQPYGDLGVQVDSTTKSPRRIGTEYRVAEFDPEDDPDNGPTSFESGPVLYRWYETQDLGEEAVKLAEETPFDYHERHQWVGDEIHHFIDLGYPKIGRRQENLRFVVGENIHALPTIEADDYATDILALGKGEGRTMKKAQARRAGARLRRATLVIDKSASQAGVNALAKREVAWRAAQDDVTSLMVWDSSHAPLGAASVGDEIYVEGPTPWGEIGVWVRILSIRISPNTEQVAEYTVRRSDKIS